MTWSSIGETAVMGQEGREYKTLLDMVWHFPLNLEESQKGG
jgi:hypothetical protein